MYVLISICTPTFPKYSHQDIFSGQSNHSHSTCQSIYITLDSPCLSHSVFDNKIETTLNRSTQISSYFYHNVVASFLVYKKKTESISIYA